MHDDDIVSFGALVATNVRSLRAGKGLDQADLAARMRSLGFQSWRRQTVGTVESGARRLGVDELLGLSLSLSVSIPDLTEPLAGVMGIELPAGLVLPVSEVQKLAGVGVPFVFFRWEGSTPIVPPGERSEAESRFVADWGDWDPDMTPRQLATYMVRVLRAAAEESDDPVLRAKVEDLETPDGLARLERDARDQLYEAATEEES